MAGWSRTSQWEWESSGIRSSSGNATQWLPQTLCILQEAPGNSREKTCFLEGQSRALDFKIQKQDISSSVLSQSPVKLFLTLPLSSKKFVG